MIDDPELASVDELLRELAELPVEPPAWSSVVDRIAVAPAPAKVGGLRVGWSAVIAGLVVALLVAGAGAVSKPVRETVFEPVANLLPWVDDAPDVDSDPAPAPTFDDPAPASDDTERPGSDVDADAETDRESDAEPGADPMPTDREIPEPTRSEPTDVREPTATNPDLDRPIDRLTRDELERLRQERRLERLRRERELAATTTEPSTTAPPATSTPSERDGVGDADGEPTETTVVRVDSDRSDSATDGTDGADDRQRD